MENSDNDQFKSWIERIAKLDASQSLSLDDMARIRNEYYTINTVRQARFFIAYDPRFTFQPSFFKGYKNILNQELLDLLATRQ